MALCCVDIRLFRCKVPYGIAQSLLFRDLDLGIHYLKRKLFSWKLSQVPAVREILHRYWPAEITSAAVVSRAVIITVQDVHVYAVCSSDLVFLLPVVAVRAVIQICSLFFLHLI
jgi:hypothetical protein